MTSPPTPPTITSREYDALRDSLTDAGALLALPELHGGVSGALCGGGLQAAERWVEEFLADHEAASLAAVRRTARALVGATWAALAGGDLAFEPLLPDEDAPLEEQVQALALWCHGFLSGLGAVTPDAELAEILTDFAEISRAGVDDEEAEDRDGADFALAELKEYARVSTQIVFENLAGRRSAGARDVH